MTLGSRAEGRWWAQLCRAGENPELTQGGLNPSVGTVAFTSIVASSVVTSTSAIVVVDTSPATVVATSPATVVAIAAIAAASSSGAATAAVVVYSA